MKKTVLAAALLACASVAIAGEISVSSVSISQDARTRRVTVEYTLGDEPAIVTVDFLTNGVSIGEANFANVIGDVNRLVSTPGRHVITWRPDKSPLAGVSFAGNPVTAEVKAWPQDDPPDYLAIDLITTNCWRFYVTADDVPLGVTNKIYKTSKLLMRKIYAKNIKWPMGTSTDGSYATPRHKLHYVTLTTNYYISVYEMTKRQYRSGSCYNFNVYDNNTVVVIRERVDDALRPMPLSFNHMRKQAASCYWPTHGHNLTSDSGLYRLRKKTGLNLDLTTEAEWEYACRAGTATKLYTGEAATEANVAKVAWFTANWTNDPVAVAVGVNTDTHAVGLLQPNAWGLYDMLGNAWEICLDVMSDKEKDTNQIDPYQGEAAENPVGPTAEDAARSTAAGYTAYVTYNGRRARRGGVTSDSTTSAMNAVAYTGVYAERRKNVSSSVSGGATSYSDIAFRLVMPAEIP